MFVTFLPIRILQHVVFCITRSKNDNTVVYRARTHDNNFVESDAIEVYWMGFSRKDPHEVDPAKLRDDLNWMEKKLAYGATATKDHRGEPDEFEVKLVAVPHLKVTMKKDATGRPRLYAVVGERNCFIVRVYVLAKENMIGLPKVIHVNIHGIDIETGEEIVEQITP